MWLEIDMGNTRSKWRVREDRHILARGVAETSAFPDERLLSLSLLGQIQKIVIAAVCEDSLFQRTSHAVSQVTGLAVSRVQPAASAGGVTCGYQTPTTLGVDRWLAVLAAHHGRSAEAAGCVVVSCGTALTIDFVRANGVHEGGYILPGITMMQNALLTGTGGIRFQPESLSLRLEPGNSTGAAVQHGAVYAALSLMERSCQDAALRWGGQPSGPQVELWLCGGDAGCLQAGLRRPSRLEEDLVLNGMRYAL